MPESFTGVGVALVTLFDERAGLEDPADIRRRAEGRAADPVQHV